ncbi:unnamed protein product, partial [marine sediment metagenome]
RHCGGEVRRKELEKDSDNVARCLSSGYNEKGVWEAYYRIFFECGRCYF